MFLDSIGIFDCRLSGVIVPAKAIICFLPDPNIPEGLEDSLTDNILFVQFLFWGVFGVHDINETLFRYMGKAVTSWRFWVIFFQEKVSHSIFCIKTGVICLDHIVTLASSAFSSLNL